MNYSKVRQNQRQFEQVTGLKFEEFDHLIPLFSDRWRKYYRIHTIEGKKRKAPLLNPYKNTKTLSSIEEKLFFILAYLKNATLQDYTAAAFDFTQSQTSKWVKALTPLLKSALKDLNMLPTQKGSQVAPMLEKLEEKKCFQDVSERLINRPSSQEKQQKFYSGKKKAHTIKNNFITTDSQFVIYLSPTQEGSMHDKKIADEGKIVFPDNIHLFQDCGFQGFKPDNVHIVQPFKKPRNGQFSEIQKWFNTYVSQIRICIEHAIGGVKRCRIVKDKSRHFCLKTRELFMIVCVGLHNFRVCSPVRKYKSKFKWGAAAT